MTEDKGWRAGGHVRGRTSEGEDTLVALCVGGGPQEKRA